MGEERARGGATIKHYGDTAAPNTAPPERPIYFNDILAHLEPILGPVETVSVAPCCYWRKRLYVR